MRSKRRLCRAFFGRADLPRRLHRHIPALLHSEDEFGVPVAYWDLFRVVDGKIVERWDVIVPIPSELAHDKGVF